MNQHFDFDQVYNFRDMGGYQAADGRTVRWRRLFRSGEPMRMSETEAAQLSDEVPIATVIDLRSEGEADHPRGLGPLLSESVTRHHFPMGDPRSKYNARSSGEWDPRYQDLMEERGATWASIVRLLAEEDAYPAVFHCVTGKDRTGVLSALILDVLGVDEATILEDFALSQRGMDRLVADLRARGRITDEIPPNPALAVPVEAMEAMLAALRANHSDAANFFGKQGVDDQTLERLTDLLLE
jgi:protein tyrosine/serine phosphatase